MLLGALLPVLGLELAFRAWGPFLPGEYRLGIEREFDPLLGWRHRPGFKGGIRTSEFAVRIAIDQHGLRDEAIPVARPPGGLRVLALGDSFLAAAHVELEQSVTKQLQDLLRDSFQPRPVEVVNGGVSGYGQAQQLLYLEHEGHKFAPDIVLVVVFLGNDLLDNIRTSSGSWERPAFGVENGRLTQVAWPRRDPARREAWDGFLLRHSTTYNFFQSGIASKLDQPAEEVGEAGTERGQDFQIYDRRPSRKIRDAWEVTEALLTAIAAGSTAIEADTVVVGAPSFRQLDPLRFRAQLQEAGLDPDEYDLEAPNRRLAEAMERQRLPYLDLLPALRRAQEQGQGDPFYPRNTHWTPAGHQAAARAIHDFLLQGSAGVFSVPLP